MFTLCSSICCLSAFLALMLAKMSPIVAISNDANEIKLLAFPITGQTICRIQRDPVVEEVPVTMNSVQ